MYHGNNVGHPLYPRTAGQTLTYIMSSRSTSLEPKSQFTIILTLGRKHEEKENSQSKKGRRHKKKRKFPNQEREKTQKRKKIPNERVGESKKKKEKFSIKDRKKTKEICRKVFGPDNI